MIGNKNDTMKSNVSKIIALLGIIRISVLHAASPPESGHLCPVYTGVKCTLPDENGAECETLSGRPFEECGEHRLHWEYEYCNENAEGMIMKMNSTRTFARTDQVRVHDITFDTSDFGVGCRVSPVVERTVNTCVRGAVASDIKIEGKLMDSNGVVLEDQPHYCFGYAFTRINLRLQNDGNDDLIPIIFPPTFDMNMECKYEELEGSGNFNVNCDQLSNANPPLDGKCERDVQFKYTITNTGGAANLMAVIDEENVNLLGDRNSLNMKSSSENPSPVTITKEKTINMCTQAGQTITAAGTAIAASDPKAVPAQRFVSLSFDLP